MIPRPALDLIRSLWRDVRGVSAVEFALIAPVLLLLYFGTAELSSALMAARKTDHALSELGDLISQTPQGVSTAQMASRMADLMPGAQAMMTPYTSPHLQMRAMGVSVHTDNTIQVDWSCIGPGTTDASIPVLTPGSVVVQASGSAGNVAGISASQAASILALLSTTNAGGTLVPGPQNTGIIVTQGSYKFSSPVDYLLPASLTFGNMYFSRPRTMAVEPTTGNVSTGIQCKG